MCDSFIATGKQISFIGGTIGPHRGGGGARGGEEGVCNV